MWAQIQDPFPNCLKLLCSCGSGIESTSHFFLDCPLFNDKRHTLLNTLNNIDSEILESTDSYLTQTLLYGCSSFDTETNTLNVTIEYFFIYWKIWRIYFPEKLPWRNFPWFIIFHYNTLLSFCFITFCTPKHSRFSVLGDCVFFCLLCYVV